MDYRIGNKVKMRDRGIVGEVIEITRSGGIVLRYKVYRDDRESFDRYIPACDLSLEKFPVVAT